VAAHLRANRQGWISATICQKLMTDPRRTDPRRRFFGFIHGEKIGLAQTPAVSVSYLAVAAVLVYCAKFALVAPKTAEIEHPGELSRVAE
jgi:hypothetical protein